MTVSALELVSQYSDGPLASDDSVQLKPVTVIDVLDRRVEVLLSGRRQWAELALPYRYDAVVGDSVLVIGQADSCYVIGLLSGRGKMTLQAPGDLDLHAPRGRIALVAGKGVLINSPLFEVISKKMSLTAESVLQNFNTFSSWVKNAYDLRAGSVHTVVDSMYRLKARRIRERAQEDVKIDGQVIKLG